MTPLSVLDTDTLSALMRRDPRATARATAYLADHPTLTISTITRFEILRGLHAKEAVSQIAAFERFCESLQVLPLSDAAVASAAKIHGKLRRSGQLIGDADTLIAATCLEHSAVIVTNNTSHFLRIDGLPVENWLAS